jgi:cellulose synthase/poly-beta-1,6-N-acetylglucosamine synthase-like glycosyltransferase
MTQRLIFDIMADSVGLALVLLTLPLVLELLLVTLAAWLPAKAEPAWRPAKQTRPRTMVVVPAHNESMLIGRCVHSLLQDRVPHSDVTDVDTDVLVVAHNCTDQTAALAEAAGAQVLMVNDDGLGGKGSALRAGLAEAVARGYHALVVVDADSTVSPGFMAVAQDALSRHQAFQVRYVLASGRAQTRARLGSLGFLGFNILRPRGRERLGLSAGIFGNGFGFRSEVLARVPYSTTSLVEDLEYHLRLVRAGVRVHFVEQATVTSEAPPSHGNASSHQQARWEGGRVLAIRLWALRLAGDLARGRWRSAEPLLDLLGLPLAMALVLLMITLAVPEHWVRLYACMALVVLATHVFSAAAEGLGWKETVKTVIAVPAYMAWKLSLVPRTLLASRPNAVWTPTARDQSLAYDARGDGA